MDNLRNGDNGRPVTKGRVESGITTIRRSNGHSATLAVGKMNARSGRDDIGRRARRRGARPWRY